MKTFSKILSIVAAFAQLFLTISAITSHNYMEAIAWGSCLFYNISAMH